MNNNQLLEETLKYASENDMLDIAFVQRQIEMQKRKELLEKHPYRIWEGNDGKWYVYLPSEEKGRELKKSKTREGIEEVVIAYWREKEDNPTIDAIFEEWVDYKLNAKEIEKATYDRYKVDYNKYFKDFGKRKIKYVTGLDVEEFLIFSISEHSLTTKAFSNLRTLVLGIFKRAKKKKYISFSITEVIKDMEIPKKAFKTVKKQDYEEVFMEDETPKVISYLCENMDVLNLGILLLFATGMRIGELVAIRCADISGNVIKIHSTETRYKGVDGKTIFEVKDTPKTEAGIREIIVPNDYVWVIEKLRRLNPFAEFLMTKDGVRVKSYSVRKRLSNVCKKVNVYKKSPHKIRKTYGSILLDNNVDKNLIIQQMGHTDIICTEQHYHRNRKNIETKIQVLSNIPELMAK